MRENILLVFFSALLVFSVLMLFVGNATRVTGYAVSTTVSNVTISSYVSMSLSTNLSSGILFGTVSNLPAVYANASHNYDGGSSMSTMFVNISTDSNSAVDLCTKANANMQDAGTDTIGIANETYANSTTSDTSSPAIANNVSFTTSYVSAGKAVARGSQQYYRVWISIPVGQAMGTYNNTLSFEGVSTGGAC